MASQRLEERLEAAVHGAAKHLTLDLHLAHARRALDLMRRRTADEGDLDPLHPNLFRHCTRA